jgi:type I restriction-modification system DNA methylase subunit
MKAKSPDFRAVLRSLSHRHDLRRVFEAFVLLAACALSMQTREPEYLEEAKLWTKEELETFAEALALLVTEMERHPFTDILGGYYMEFALSQKGQQWNGEFHTPKPICDLMARITLGDVEALPAEEKITVCEPACGSGAMILSFGEACPPHIRRRLRVTAIDINRTACHMAFINTTLWGIPTRIIHGNSLSLECWAAWSNIHYLMPWLPLTMRMEFGELPLQGQPPAPVEVEQIKASLQQTEWNFG